MTRDELVKAIATDAGISQVAADKALTSFCQRTTEALALNDEVRISGFGIFSSTAFSGNIRNPSTGEAVDGTAVRVNFRAGVPLKAHLKAHIPTRKAA